MKTGTLSCFQTIDCCSDRMTVASATWSLDEKLVVAPGQRASVFEEIPAQQMVLAVGGLGWSPYQKSITVPALSAKDQAKWQQALGQGAIWGAGGAIVTAIVPGGLPFAPAAGLIGFATGVASSLYSSYGPGSSP